MEKDSVRTVVEALDNEEIVPKEITLSTGVVLRGKQAPPLTLVHILSRYPRPKVPVYFNKTMGRDMENPDNPEYLEEVQSWKMEMADAVLSALILLGTQLLSKPDGFPGPDDDEWLDEYRLLGLDMMPENKSWRYLSWVKFKAVVTADDTKKIREVVGRLSGVPETSVQAAEDFPGRKQDGRGE